MSCQKIEVTSSVSPIIFIDPGHGGKDNGTSYQDIFEDEINLEISTLLYESLLQDNYICYLTRINDYDLSSTYSKNHKIEDLKKRVEYINNLKADVLVSLHLNYYPNSNVNGLQVFYKGNSESSYNLASIMQEKINELNKKNKKIKEGDFYILNNINTTGILIEYGFLSSEYDRKNLMNRKYKKKLVNIIKEGIISYFNEKI